MLKPLFGIHFMSNKISKNFYRQRDQEYCEWYIRYTDLSDILTKYMPSDSKILHVGAGSSSKFINVIYLRVNL